MWLGASLWRAAGAVFGRDHEAAAAALLDEALRILDGQEATKWRALCHVRRADLLLIEGTLLPVLAEYDRALFLAQSTGHSYGLLVCGGNRSYLLFQLGRQDEAMTAPRRS